jgi:alpha-L-fucosidase 2
MTGTLDDGRGGKGVSYAARLRVQARGGTVKAEGNTIQVERADEVVLLLAADTDYKGFAGRCIDNPIVSTRRDVDLAAKKSFAQLRADQKADHEKFFNRVQLTLAETANSALSTLDRLKGFEKGAEDPALAALYFNFGRYLLISSSGPGGLPANLQGIWAEEIRPPWNADWHLNINVQMNYWPAEVCNLSELHEPLQKLTSSLVEPGRKTAKDYYNARGWVAHVITNAWGFTSPGEQASWGSSTLGSAWLCHHIWEHYAFSQDKNFLRQAYPILKEASIFYMDCIFEEPEHKWLVTGPSNSPENRFFLPDGKKAHVCIGPTMDMQLIRELFRNTSQTASILGVDKNLQKELDTKAAQLAPNQIGPDGRLQEWLLPYPEPDPTHRHISHLYGLFPGYEITRQSTPEFAEAARRSLDARGDQCTGWALAWRINCWARLGDGDRAYSMLKALLKPTTVEEGRAPNGRFYPDGRGAGCYANLFDSCPPFQIDGNFGGAAGIAEMLLQSNQAEVELLPALPKAWPSGKVTGLRARGAYTVDIEWKDGIVTNYRIASADSQTVTVRVNGKTETVQSQKL